MLGRNFSRTRRQSLSVGIAQSERKQYQGSVCVGFGCTNERPPDRLLGVIDATSFAFNAQTRTPALWDIAAVSFQINGYVGDVSNVAFNVVIDVGRIAPQS